MARIEQQIEIAAPPARVWAVISDVERWPDWTPTVTRAAWVGDSGLAVGRRARLVQPKLPPTIWHVTRVDEGSAFTWEANNPGTRIVAHHALAAIDGGTRVTLSVEMTGALAWLVHAFTGALTRRYVATEAESLKKKSESAA